MAEHVALLNFGSNAVRFVHARLSRRGVEFLKEGRLRARLASGPHGALNQAAIEQTLRAARRFLRGVEEFQPRLLAVAMASVRDAPNSHDLLQRLGSMGVPQLVFNSVMGYMRPRPLHHMLMAPLGMREAFVARVKREAEHARNGRAARMILKMNSLVDPVLIEALYAASRAGAEITLIVRGICCLCAGVLGQSENIRVVSIIDRYLEHARIYYFENDGQPEYWLSSADWMPRNLDMRVELAFPLLDPRLQEELRHMLELQIADRAKARELSPDGKSRRLYDEPGRGLRSQEALYARVQEAWKERAQRAPELAARGSNGELMTLNM